MDRFQALHEECERHIRAGEIQAAARKLRSLAKTKVPRAWVLPLANVCRRARLINQALRLLTPVVRPEKRKWQTDATAREVVEYALLLERSGSTEEALVLLQKVDPTQAPEALFAQTACLFSRWDYELAIPVLQRYLDLAPDAYARLVGQVNLSAAYIASGKTQQALQRLSTTLEQARESRSLRLIANCLELKAQAHIREQRLDLAKEDLAESSRILGDSLSPDQLYANKWLSILESLQSGSKAPLLRFREQALHRSDWESVREADRHLLKVEFDERLLHHLYAGTPHPSYRTELARETGFTSSLHEYRLGSSEGATLHLTTGELIGVEASLNPGKQTHTLLSALFRDFYSPIRIGGLFYELFPNEHFDVFSSPQRVRMAISRARAWLAQEGLPITIIEDRARYSAQVTGNLGVIVPVDRSAVHGPEAQWALLKSRLAANDRLEFTAREARELLSASYGTLNRLLSWALEQDRVERSGAGPKTRYFIPAASDSRLKHSA